jgi:hypothetical protein
MDFFALILFTALYYLRPQDWSPDFDTLHPIQLLSVLALFAMVQTGKIKPRDLVRTPLDWLVLLYFIWTLIAGFQFGRTLGEIQSVLLFYFVAVRSLDTIPRLKTFLSWWCGFILIIAVLAIASLYGFDPLNSNDITQSVMKGRLILNLSIFDNPNALAHSVIPAIPLIYYLFVWRRIGTKPGIVAIIIPAYCILLTQSKGAFLSGFVTLLATLTFGRSKIWQVVILVMTVLFGYGALYSLPRMSELQKSKTDPAIQGRVAAFSFGLRQMNDHWFGMGLGNFKDRFLEEGPLEKHEVIRDLPEPRPNAHPGEPVRASGTQLRHRVALWDHYAKAAHSSYNDNGAELGYPGLFLFVGILYGCLRTLLLMKCDNSEEERVRRALFAMVVAYAASSWMVDFAYRPTFFLFVAAISALHRYYIHKQEAAMTATEGNSAPALPPWLRRPPLINMPGITLPGLPIPVIAGSMIRSPVLSSTNLQSNTSTALVTTGGNSRILPWQKQPEPAPAPETPRTKFIWNRLGILDLLIMLALTEGTIFYWKHLIATM